MLEPVYIMTDFEVFWHTSLGEKGREALIRVGSFALFSQVSIGLDVHRALAIQERCQDIPQKRFCWITYLYAVLQAVELNVTMC